MNKHAQGVEMKSKIGIQMSESESGARGMGENRMSVWVKLVNKVKR